VTTFSGGVVTCVNVYNAAFAARTCP